MVDLSGQGLKPDLDDHNSFLVTVAWLIWAVENRPYDVSSGTLSLYHLTSPSFGSSEGTITSYLVDLIVTEYSQTRERRLRLLFTPGAAIRDS